MKIYACCPICGCLEFVVKYTGDRDWAYYCANCDKQIDTEEMILKEEPDCEI